MLTMQRCALLQPLTHGVLMKKLLLASAFLAIWGFTACEVTLLDSNTLLSQDSQSGNLVSASGAESASYSSSVSPNIIEVSPATASLTISGLSSGKTVWMTKTNPSKNVISSSYTRYVSSVSGLTTSSGNVSTSSSDSGGTGWIPWIFHNEGSEPCVSLRLNASLPALSLSESRSLLPSEALQSVVQISPVVNSTPKNIYVDTNSDMSAFAAKKATLRASGAYCYVWVIDDRDFLGNSKYWTSGSVSKSSDGKGGQQINSEIAQSIADNFDKIYPMVRKVFGQESDKIIYQAKSISEMSSWSDTGTKVNIVVYDIGNDYSSTSSDTGGTVGYFYSKDYYYQYNNGDAAYSNAGKYFYIDAYYTANETAMVYSTLAHEFQHMVDFGVKTMASLEKNTRSPLQSSTWYNEMKSMLCEDIMKNYLEEANSDFTDDDSPFRRFPMFCRHYYDTGLEYKTSGTYDVYYSYANNYAFGAWAARNYGGLSFINKIATNNYVDIDSITAASGCSIEEMLKKYTAACLVNKEKYGFNIALDKSDFEENNYYYPLDAVNLWDLKKLLPDSYSTFKKNNPTADISSYYSFAGPVYFGYNSQKDLRPYGFALSKVGTTTSSTITLNFNRSNIDDAQRTYIIIE